MLNPPSDISPSPAGLDMLSKFNYENSRGRYLSVFGKPFLGPLS